MPAYVMHVRYKDGSETEWDLTEKEEYKTRFRNFLTNRYDVAGWWVTEEKVIASSYKETTLMTGIR